ncbi:MAG TPA: hypothetical protein VJ998_07045 [Pseudomonadales bacterium]|nr:hypothetical protein [Pseudomonadales bacterium]
MNFRIKGALILLASMLLAMSNAAFAGAPPVAKLVQAEGDVQYSRDGNNWRPIRGTKYLFSGYKVKTGSDGTGRLINEADGTSQVVAANTVFSVGDDKVTVVEGKLSAPKEQSTTLFQSLSNKFAKAQRYTTVRRGAERSECDNKVRTIKKVALSDEHPDLVWRNACPEYSYRVVIDGKGHDIPAESTAEMIRYPVKGVSPGPHQ